MRVGVSLMVALAGCGVATPRCPEGMSVQGERCVCDAPRYYDGDGDGFGAGEPRADCALRARIVARGGDCDDADGARHPAAEEECNGVDDDCDGLVDEDFECQREGFVPCATDCGAVGTLACSSECTFAEDVTCAPPPETCNGADDDCDGLVDEGTRGLAFVRTVSEDAALGVAVRGFEGGMVVATRGIAASSLLVLGADGARLRSDRALDPLVDTPRFASRDGALLLRGVHGADPPRPFCGSVGPAPDYALTSSLCEGELPEGVELSDVLADGLYEVWVARVGDRLHAGILGLGPASLSPLTVSDEPLVGERVFGVSHLGRLVVQGGGELAVMRRVATDTYEREADLGASLSVAVTVVDEETSIAQVRSNHFLVRRYGGTFACASAGYDLGACNEGAFLEEVSVAGESPIALGRIGRRTFVAYTAEGGASLGFLELDQDDEDVAHARFAEGEGPFVDVFVVDVGEALPRVLARTAAGALRLYALTCPAG